MMHTQKEESMTHTLDKKQATENACRCEQISDITEKQFKVAIMLTE